MTADMFCMPTLPQKPPSSFQSDKPGSFSSNPPTKTEPPGWSNSDEHEDFLSTLKHVSRDRTPSEKLVPSISHDAVQSDKTALHLENEQEPNIESVRDEALLDIVALLLDDEASLKDQTPVAAELKEVMALLEVLDLTGSPAEQMAPPGAGLVIENTSDPAEKGRNPVVALKQLIEQIQSNTSDPAGKGRNPVVALKQFIEQIQSNAPDPAGKGRNPVVALKQFIEQIQSNAPDPAGKGQNPVVALKQLIEQIQSHDHKPGNDMSTGLERLRLVIAETPADGVSAHSGGRPQGGSNLNELPGSVDFADGFKGLNQGQKIAVNINGAMAEDGPGGEKPAESPSTMTRSANETENVLKVPGSIKAVGNSQIAFQSEHAEKTAAAKLPADMRMAAEANEIAKAPQFTENGSGKAGNSDPSPSSADSGRHSGGQPLHENSLTGGTSPISKLINDAQVEKENPLKVDVAAGDNDGSKVGKIEAATHDNGQLNSQAQTSEKAPESVSSPKETEAGQRELQTRTLEQIVRRAVIQARDGRHEARIDLKPDFLGHVRMQVITENQQVTVKILTEFGFVKEMIDNNIQQLKADLQHQGLQVDKLDVSVSRDANGNKHPQENAQHARNMDRKDNSDDRGDAREEWERPTDRSALRAQGVSTVDYFA